MHKPMELQKATEVIQSAETIVIVTHIGPDGDAIGSSLGLGNALKQMGKDVTIAVDKGVPEFFSWLPNSETIVGELTSGSWDVAISTDSSDEERTGKVGEYARANSKTVINLDHHVTNTYFGDIHLVDPEAVSAAQIVYEWWQHVGIEWEYDIAQPILTGMVTDTLGFRINATTPETLGIAQQLMYRGASLAEATQRTLGVMSAQELLLWKRVIPTIEIEGEVASVIVRTSDLEAVGITEDFSTGQLVGLLRGVTEVHIAAVFREDDAEDVKISLRADPGYNVAEVATQLGGGGHTLAAGANLMMTVEDAVAKTLPLLQEAAKKGKPEIG